MDPLTGIANIITALTNLVTELMKSQPPAVQVQLWTWYVQDVAWWRKLFKLDPSAAPPTIPPPAA